MEKLRIMGILNRLEENYNYHSTCTASNTHDPQLLQAHIAASVSYSWMILVFQIFLEIRKLVMEKEQDV